MKFYGIKTKMYLEASFIIMCDKESVRNNLKFLCNMPIRSTDDRLTGHGTPFSGYRTKKTAAMAHLSML